MENKQNKYYNALKVLSYNGIFTMIISNRNYGKTWAFKRRAWRRALKHGKKTLWLRTFKKEVKETAPAFYASRDLQKYCGIIPWDKEKKTGNFKQEGNTFYYRKNNKWYWFLKISRVGDADALRSVDDVDVDTIVYDEFTTTAEREKRYRGNRCNDFMDIFFTSKRQHQLRCFFLGNKENVLNPFLSYFGIKPIANTFEGIKTFRNGSLIYQQINNKPKNQTQYDAKVSDLFKGTMYGAYIYEDAFKNQFNFKPRKAPQGANEYIQLNINGYEIKISVLNGFFYVSDKIDAKRRVYTLVTMNKYKNELLLVKRQKRLFIALINALSDARVFYNSVATYEAIQPFYVWLGV